MNCSQVQAEYRSGLSILEATFQNLILGLSIFRGLNGVWENSLAVKSLLAPKGKFSKVNMLTSK